MMSPTFFECPNCKDFSTQIREVCGKCGHPNFIQPVGTVEPSNLRTDATKVSISSKKKPYAVYAVSLFILGILTIGLSNHIDPNRDSAEHCKIADIENGKLPKSSFVLLDDHFSLYSAGVLLSKSQADLNAGIVNRCVFPVYSQALYARAMGKDGEIPPLSVQREELNKFAVLLINDRFTNKKQLPLMATREPFAQGRIVKGWGVDIDPNLSSMKKYFKGKNFSETIVIDTTQTSNDRKQTIRFLLMAVGFVATLISFGFATAAVLQFLFPRRGVTHL